MALRFHRDIRERDVEIEIYSNVFDPIQYKLNMLIFNRSTYHESQESQEQNEVRNWSPENLRQIIRSNVPGEPLSPEEFQKASQLTSTFTITTTPFSCCTTFYL
jgi:hypothetical protein